MRLSGKIERYVATIRKNSYEGQERGYLSLKQRYRLFLTAMEKDVSEEKNPPIHGSRRERRWKANKMNSAEGIIF